MYIVEPGEVEQMRANDRKFVIRKDSCIEEIVLNYSMTLNLDMSGDIQVYCYQRLFRLLEQIFKVQDIQALAYQSPIFVVSNPGFHFINQFRCIGSHIPYRHAFNHF